MGKHYTPDYVAQAVRLCDESPRQLADIARDLDVPYATLYGWMRKAGKPKSRVPRPPPDVPVAKTPEAMQAEIERLRRELDETRKQLEFAKKAAAFFAQQNK